MACARRPRAAGEAEATHAGVARLLGLVFAHVHVPPAPQARRKGAAAAAAPPALANFKQLRYAWKVRGKGPRTYHCKTIRTKLCQR